MCVNFAYCAASMSFYCELHDYGFSFPLKFNLFLFMRQFLLLVKKKVSLMNMKAVEYANPRKSKKCSNEGSDIIIWELKILKPV